MSPGSSLATRQTNHSGAGTRRWRKPGRTLAGIAGALFILLLATAVPAGAAYTPGPPPGSGPIAVAETDVVLTSLGAGQAVTGGLPPVGSGFDPTAGYPTDVPAGYETTDQSFAGVLNTTDVAGNAESMYCIDLRTSTYIGVGYENGTWDEANVPNIGYINRILNSYYPDQPGLPAADNDNIRAAAVQAAIWFFSDGYVLSASDPARGLVADIVAAVLAAGPLVEPPPPDVTITPPTAAGPTDGVTGPFIVDAAGAAELTVEVPDGFTLYADAAGTQPLVSPATVPAGTQLWVGNNNQTTDSAVISARAVVPVETGNVYLYSGNIQGLDAAQKLILAADAEASSSAEATAEFFVAGDLVVNKTFAGAGAGQQGLIGLNIDCGASGVFSVEIPAGASTPVSETISGLPVGTVCTVTEPANGSTDAVTVTASLPAPVEITAGENSVTVTNTVEFNPGALLLRKTVSGNGATVQGEIVVSVQCGDGLVDETFVLPAGTAAGEYTALYENIPAGTLCRITEPESGASEDVTVETTLPEDVTIVPAQVSEALVSNVYATVPVTERLPKTGAEATTGLVLAGSGAVLAGSLLILGSWRIRRAGTGNALKEH